MKTKRIVIALLTFLVILLVGIVAHNGNINYLMELILKGFGITIVITLISVILGTIFGTVISKFRSSADKIFNVSAKSFIKFIQIITILILLIAVYYTFFMKMPLVLVYAAICIFVLNFALSSSEIIKNGMDIVDKGQIEAAEATGFNMFQIFKLIIFPQALKYILPLYRYLSANIFKMVSAIGYLAILDLENANRTFGITILMAIIYFLMIFIFAELVEYCELKISSKCSKSAEVQNDANN